MTLHLGDAEPFLRVRRATPDDVHRLARLFAAAFAADPVFDWLARSGPARLPALERFFYWTLRQRTLQHNETWLTEDGLAAAAWIPPYSEEHPVTFWDEIRLTPVLLRLTGAFRLARGASMATAMEQAHPRQPYHYLALIAVAPRFQGNGLGSALLEQTLARADASGVPSYVENSNPRNLRLYERAGFSVVHEIRARKDAPPLFAMWRPAQGSSTLSQ